MNKLTTKTIKGFKPKESEYENGVFRINFKTKTQVWDFYDYLKPYFFNTNFGGYSECFIKEIGYDLVNEVNKIVKYINC